jgi:hypothetical protein
MQECGGYFCAQETLKMAVRSIDETIKEKFKK